MLPASSPRSTLSTRYRDVRATTEGLVEPLAAEDCVVQSMPDVSPTKWHLAHVTWFFETFVLEPHLPGYRSPAPEFTYLFNSYYNSVGRPYPRPRRGLLSRPTVDEVRAYRAHVDEQIGLLLDSEASVDDDVADLVEVGLNHEQQHQELLLMDIKHVLSCNPLHPAYRQRATWPRDTSTGELGWRSYPSGVRRIGHDGPGFCYDNEAPRHEVFVRPFELASRLVTNGELREFIADGGYRRPELWLADGWSRAEEEGWTAPLYWVRREGEWHEFSLAGLRPLDPGAPVCHVSYYEAAAFAAWVGARLPTEAEWEVAAAEQPVEGNFLERGLLHPRGSGAAGPGPHQLYGDLWEWTGSAYAAYPGFRAAGGAIAEYNGKFMCNQQVLRGGACVTPRSHVRPTYRNFFYPHCRWCFSGIRLARDA